MKSKLTKQDWQNYFEDQKKSQMTIREYCASKGLNYHTFRYHKDRYRNLEAPMDKTNSSFFELIDKKTPEVNFDSSKLFFRFQIKIGEVLNCEIKLG